MSWHERVDAVWADEALDDMARVRAIDELAAERAPGDAQALFEQAGARDSAGLEEDAEPLYRAALRGGARGRSPFASRDPAREHAAQPRTP